jgi:hypothetical protein
MASKPKPQIYKLVGELEGRILSRANSAILGSFPVIFAEDSAELK